MSVSVPANVAGTSIETLSVSISNRLSPGFTASPAALNHLVILPSATVSPSCGISTSMNPCASLDAYPDDVLRRADRPQDQPVALEPVLPHDLGRRVRADVAGAMMRHRTGGLVDGVGAEIGQELRDRRGRALLARRHDLHRHVAGRIVDDDAVGLAAAIFARLAVISRAAIAPGTEEAPRDLAVWLLRIAHQLTEMYWVSRNSIRPSCEPSRPR